MKKLLIAGGSGLIGQAIISQLKDKDILIHVLSRSKKTDTDKLKYFQWDPEKRWIEDGALQVDYIINLAGAGIADKRWTDSRKNLIIESRVHAAELIHQHLLKLDHKPEAYISASAIGYYGDSGDQWVDETSEPIDEGFLSECTQLWEKAAASLHDAVVRLVIIRIGIVLSKDGGALPKMLLPFKVRLASYFGDGKMYNSWIHIEDVARLFIETLFNDNWNGTYNAVAPDVVTNKQLIESIKSEKSGFYLLNSVPTFALRTAMGEMADVVLTSNRVQSSKTINNGFNFNYPDLKKALTDLID